MIPFSRKLRYAALFIALFAFAPKVTPEVTYVDDMYCMAVNETPAGVIKSSNSVFVVNVFTETGAGRGSATYIGDGFFVSAWHVVDGALPEDTITLTKPDGTCYNVIVVAVDDVWDIALLKTEAKVKEKPVKVALEEQKPGDWFWGAGYGASMHDDKPGTELRIFKGFYKGHCRAPGQLHKGWFMFSNGAIPGDSGGAVFNSKGQLVGDLWGRLGNDCTFVVTNGIFRKFLIANGVKL